MTPRHPFRLRARGALAAITCGSVFCVLTVAVGSQAWSATPSQIEGSGSSWAENAVNQWVADVNSQGVQVVYSPDGDAAGRQDFANQTSDFSVTSEGYQGTDPATGQADTSNGRPYAYLPIAAGGTAFPYQIRVDGGQVANLRLSGQTLTKIFTNQITNWDDPAITKDNNGVQLPSLPIIPVVQAEGSGATQQLTTYFATEFPGLWSQFAGVSSPTEYWPRQGSQVAENGSNQAMNYVASAQANGSISYVEYSFALSVNFPVAKILNSAGYFTLPTQYNVAVALEDAQINTDKSSPNYLLQNLTNVYSDPDNRTYPLSSYVYMIEPTGTYPSQDPKITTGKRQALADFEYYSICQGQKELGPIGYSPLPVNLVQAAFDQVQELQSADSSVDLANLNILTCNNPTFVPGQPNTNYLAQIAPMPPACDQIGQGPCAAGITPNGLGSTPGSSGSYGQGLAGPAAGKGNSAATASTGSSSGLGSAGKGASGTAGSGSATDGSTSAGTSGSRTSLKYVSVNLPAGTPWLAVAFGAVALLLVAFLVPVLVAFRRGRKSGELGP